MTKYFRREVLPDRKLESTSHFFLLPEKYFRFSEELFQGREVLPSTSFVIGFLSKSAFWQKKYFYFFLLPEVENLEVKRVFLLHRFKS
jgi:hypothetical protein